MTPRNLRAPVRCWLCLRHDGDGYADRIAVDTSCSAFGDERTLHESGVREFIAELGNASRVLRFVGVLHPGHQAGIGEIQLNTYVGESALLAICLNSKCFVHLTLPAVVNIGNRLSLPDRFIHMAVCRH
jgi:hypothetical protein